MTPPPLHHAKGHDLCEATREEQHREEHARSQRHNENATTTAGARTVSTPAAGDRRLLTGRESGGQAGRAERRQPIASSWTCRGTRSVNPACFVRPARGRNFSKGLARAT